MQPLTILLVSLFVLFIQFDQDQAANNIPLSSSENDEHSDSPALSTLLKMWYNGLNNIEDNEQQDSNYHLWKRYSAEFSPYRERRRFGNTRYGRDLNKNWRFK